MKSKQLLQITTFVSILFLVGCGGGSEDTPVPAPGTTTLSLPANNTACLKSSSTTGSTASVTFSWSTASNADNYRLDIKNLNTQTTVSYNTSSTSYSLSLDVNIPYSWDVAAINNTGKTTSDVWKFYLSGAASSSYAPFPADLTSPASGATISANGAATVQVTFQWSGSDPDNDIASYAFYIDNINASTQVVASQTASTLTQNLSSGKSYYWKIVTTDKVGNNSSSAVSFFQIQ